MDPDETLRQLRALNAELADETSEEEKVFELCMLIAALDEWMTHGGFLPRDWNQFRQTP